MKEKNNILKMQFLHMFSRLEFKVSLAIVSFFVMISFIELCLKVSGMDKSELLSAPYGWIGHPTGLDLHIIQAFIYLLIFIVSAMAFSDSQFVDRDIGTTNIILTRCPRKKYILSGAAASFVGAFIVIAVPFLFSLLFSFILFPAHGAVQQLSYQTPAFKESDDFETLFPLLFYRYPVLYDLLSIFYMSVCCGIFAVFSFSLSYFLKRRLLVLCLPSLLVFLEGVLFPGRYTFIYYFYMGNILGITIYIYLGIPLAVLLISCFLLFLTINKMRDELY